MTALLWSSTLVDFELLCFLLTGRPFYHGFWHSYIFVLTVYPVMLSLIIYMAERKFDKTLLDVYRFFRFYPREVRYSFKKVYISCLIGGVSHLFFDMWVHKTSPYILFPIHTVNHFWIGEWGNLIYIPVSVLSLYSVFLWIRQMKIHQETLKQGLMAQQDHMNTNSF